MLWSGLPQRNSAAPWGTALGNYGNSGVSAVVVAADRVRARRGRGRQAHRLGRLAQRADLVRLVLFVGQHALQRLDQALVQDLRPHRGLGDLAQGDDRVLVAVAIDRQLGAARNLARALRRKQDEIETVGNLVDTIFDGNARHGALRNTGCSESRALRRQGCGSQGFPPARSRYKGAMTESEATGEDYCDPPPFS